jgi:hypothetical protein
MKYYLQVICTSFVLLFALNNTSAQTDIHLMINHEFNGVNLDYNEASDVGGLNVSITRLQYYISEITITHDGGQTTDLEDVYVLANGLDQGDYFLGSWDITDVEQIQFSIGIDAAQNHLDPSVYPVGNPLALQSPSMHWGWASGYRFLVIEGWEGADLNSVYQIHALGDANFHSQSHSVTGVSQSGALTIYLEAEYANILTDINIAGGVIEHSETASECLDALVNMRDSVFSAGSPIGVSEEELSNSLVVYPNPASDILSIQSSVDVVGVKIFDTCGRLVYSELNSGPINISRLQEGVYSVQLFHESSAFSSRTIIIQR